MPKSTLKKIGMIKSRRPRGLKSLMALVVFLSFAIIGVKADLISVDWNADGSTDGVAAGTLGPLGVTFTSTNGPSNGGATFGTNWQTNLGTNQTPGINGPNFVSEAVALDWNGGAAGSATFTFTGGTVTDPILLFNFLDATTETFDFSDLLTLTLLDQNPGSSVTIAAGNVVTTNGAHNNTANDGFALQLTGTFSSITFATNTNSDETFNSVGITVAVPEPSAVPEGGATAALLAFGLLPLLAVRGRRSRAR